MKFFYAPNTAVVRELATPSQRFGVCTVQLTDNPFMAASYLNGGDCAITAGDSCLGNWIHNNSAVFGEALESPDLLSKLKATVAGEHLGIGLVQFADVVHRVCVHYDDLAMIGYRASVQ